MLKNRPLVRPLVRDLHAYVPGEQPKIKGLIKLNTNENPYPPSPKVLAAIKQAVDGRLRLYPNPTAQPLREALARHHGCGPENVFLGNGCDECLAYAVRAFVEPAEDMNIWRKRGHRTAATVQYFSPSYSLYPVLADIHGAEHNEVPLNPDLSIPPVSLLRRAGAWDFGAALTFITTPNAPGGRGYPTAELDRLCQSMRGVVVLDEAYADFAREDALALALHHRHVLVARTFSKAYSLCFQRVGYCVGHPELIQGLDKIRDSYNVNGLGQVAALATLEDLAHYRANIQRIVATRDETSRRLIELGFDVLPSEANFLFVKPPGAPAEAWLKGFRENKILVRWFDQPATRARLRMSIGTPEEMNSLVKVAGLLRRGIGAG